MNILSPRRSKASLCLSLSKSSLSVSAVFTMNHTDGCMVHTVSPWRHSWCCTHLYKGKVTGVVVWKIKKKELVKGVPGLPAFTSSHTWPVVCFGKLFLTYRTFRQSLKNSYELRSELMCRYCVLSVCGLVLLILQQMIFHSIKFFFLSNFHQQLVFLPLLFQHDSNPVHKARSREEKSKETVYKMCMKEHDWPAQTADLNLNQHEPHTQPSLTMTTPLAFERWVLNTRHCRSPTPGGSRNHPSLSTLQTLD